MRSYGHELSGGLAQRVVIALALVGEPRLLLADEPTSALDVTVQAQILSLLVDLQRRFETAILFVSHDLGVVAQTCRRVYVMYAGRIVEEAPIRELFAAPRHPYTVGLMSSIPSLDPSAAVERLRTIPGSPPDLAALIGGCRFLPRCPIADDGCARDDVPARERRRRPRRGLSPARGRRRRRRRLRRERLARQRRGAVNGTPAPLLAARDLRRVYELKPTFRQWLLRRERARLYAVDGVSLAIGKARDARHRRRERLRQVDARAAARADGAADERRDRLRAATPARSSRGGRCRWSSRIRTRR